MPETDNVQVSGACVHSSSMGANFSIVTFGADIGDLENGKDTELRVSGGGFDHALKGKIFRATGEEGLNGVQVDIGNDDPLWRAFAEKDSLDYLVPGYKAASLDFTRGRDKIQQFVKACETFADASPPRRAPPRSGGDAEKEAFDSAKELGTVEGWEAFIANYPSGFHADLARAYIKKLGDTAPAPLRPADEASMPNVSASREVPDPPCRNRKNIRSMVSEEKTKLTFINRSGATRNIIWIDFDSKAKSFGRLKNGEQIELDTFVTHPWMVTNSSGACLQIVEPDSGARVVELKGSGEQPAEKPVAKEVNGLRGGLQAGQGQLQAHHLEGTVTRLPGRNQAGAGNGQLRADHQRQVKKSGCGKGQISVDGKCMSKNQAVGYCGPGYHAAGRQMPAGLRAAERPAAVDAWLQAGHGLEPEEGCHEDD